MQIVSKETISMKRKIILPGEIRKYFKMSTELFTHLVMR